MWLMDLRTETEVQFRETAESETLAAFMAPPSYYPLGDDDDADTIRTNVRLPRELDADIKLIAALWTALDVAMKKKSPRKWKGNSVMERFIQVGVAGFWDQVGGRPDTAEDRDAFVERAIARLAKRGDTSSAPPDDSDSDK